MNPSVIRSVCQQKNVQPNFVWDICMWGVEPRFQVSVFNVRFFELLNVFDSYKAFFRAYFLLILLHNWSYQMAQTSIQDNVIKSDFNEVMKEHNENKQAKHKPWK